ncbi:MAG: hypothetical protein PWP23_786 [Candidatus Sumerlaeota bacterium]|nr:hypothetical protein [Candidatus Sumerlaeota bacterium]
MCTTRATTKSLRRTRRSFVLLEVMVALVILSVVLTTLLRGFVIAMSAIRENRVVETATLLAESLLEDYELEPPMEGSKEGTFEEDERFGEAFAAYTWERRVEEIDVDYDEIPRDPLMEPEPLYELTLSIRYDDGRHRPFRPFEITTYLMDSQLYSDEALQENQLF